MNQSEVVSRENFFQIPGAQEEEMPWRIEMKPLPPEQDALEAFHVGNREDQYPSGLQYAGNN